MKQIIKRNPYDEVYLGVCKKCGCTFIADGDDSYPHDYFRETRLAICPICKEETRMNKGDER